MKKRWEAIEKRIPKDKPFFMAEIGVERGKTSRYLLANCRKLIMTLVDRWCVTPEGDTYFQGSRVMSRWDARTWASIYKQFQIAVRPFSSRVRIMRMDSVSAAAKVEDGSLDLVFIDGDHSYDGVCRDIDAWMPKVRRGGILCGHDYGNENTYGNVKKAVDEKLGAVELDVDHTWFYRIPE